MIEGVLWVIFWVFSVLGCWCCLFCQLAIVAVFRIASVDFIALEVFLDFFNKSLCFSTTIYQPLPPNHSTTSTYSNSPTHPLKPTHPSPQTHPPIPSNPPIYPLKPTRLPTQIYPPTAKPSSLTHQNPINHPSLIPPPPHSRICRSLSSQKT